MECICCFVPCPHRFIAVDELGGSQDIEAVYSVIHCGCKLIATIHGNGVEDIKNRPGIRKLIDERIFERYIVLRGDKEIGRVHAIFDQRGSILYGGDMLC